MHFLAPDEFRKNLVLLLDELKVKKRENSGPRIMISSRPMASGNMKVPEIIENRGGTLTSGGKQKQFLFAVNGPSLETHAEFKGSLLAFYHHVIPLKAHPYRYVDVVGDFIMLKDKGP